MAVSYPTASLTPVLKKPRQRHAGGAFLCALCRSELAREKPEGDAFVHGERINVNVFREQARSYRAAAFLCNFQISKCCLKS